MRGLIDMIAGSLGVLDLVALATFFACIRGMRWMVERSSDARPSTARLMARYRRQWMGESPKRANRMVDSSLLINQRNGAAFLASGSLIAIGGLAAMLGQAEQMVDEGHGIVADLAVSRQMWELKLLFLMVLMVDTFLKFVWAHRIFGYCGVLLGAMPEDGPQEEIDRAVDRTARLNIGGARSFNRGLRGVYYILAALAWLLGPLAFIAAVLFTTALIYRREFLSDTRRALM